jgi:CheY-like chemotaxis protein
MSSSDQGTFSGPSSGPGQPKYHILLVEDNVIIRRLSAQALGRAGYEVDTAGDGLSGWEALRNQHYDLLITDNEMPGLSGLEMVRSLRAALSTVPVILASGGMDAEQLRQNHWLQPAVTLTKPFTTEQMLNTVAETLRASVSIPSPAEIPFPVPTWGWRHEDSWPHWGLNE